MARLHMETDMNIWGSMTLHLLLLRICCRSLIAVEHIAIGEKFAISMTFALNLWV